MARPVGVTILAVLTIVGGVLSVSIGLLFLLGSGFLIRYTAMPNFIASIAPTVDTLGFGVAVLDFAMAYGLLRLENWGRILTMIATVIFLALAILGSTRAMLRSDMVPIPRQAITAVVDVVILWYLSRPRVKSAFSRVPRAAEPPAASGTPAASV